MIEEHYINIQSLKNWASRSLSAAPYLKFLILSERNELSVEEFILKVDVWSRLLNEETIKK
jgi:hypothetical protein